MRIRRTIVALAGFVAGLAIAGAASGTAQASRDWGKPPQPTTTLAESRDWSKPGVVAESRDW